MESSYSVKYLSEKLLLKKSGNDASRISDTVYKAKISLNPHQIQAALFSFSSPISKGVMLCDEVGLGKTIEAGIIISQYWCENKKNIVIITPASLTRQWKNELADKFFLESVIVDRKFYDAEIKRGVDNPFNNNQIMIMSINFASNMSDVLKKANIDLVVIDEAHKLRNVYNPRNIMANNILNGIREFKKVLLTATPLQNNLLELFGLSKIIDDKIFPDVDFYKQYYINEYDEHKYELKAELNQFIHRTLRNQVQKYVKYSNRITHTYEYIPSEEECALQDEIINFIRSNPSLGTENGRNNFALLILAKLLSSSTAALVATLEKIKYRLEHLSEEESDNTVYLDLDDDTEEEFETGEFQISTEPNDVVNEINSINRCLELAKEIKEDTKAKRLLEAIQFLFSFDFQNREKKILIFTESRVTQDYIYNFLIKNGYSKIIKFNGSNNDDKANKIYIDWINKPENRGQEINSKATNIRNALLDYFRDSAEIMIATEAGAEGLNMQFCSMMINYDLPWNPQRVEQRIGRCHRFGQINDVIVVNFLNKKSIMDSRIYEILQNKFMLFDDVFGSSDEVLGELESETNFEKEIFNIFKSCRSPKEIDLAFNKLQSQYKSDISNEMKKTRQLLLDHFDERLQLIFDNLLQETLNSITNIEKDFWRICTYLFNQKAIFGDYEFTTNKTAYNMAPGRYIVSSPDKIKINLHFNDSNGENILKACEELPFGSAVKFYVGSNNTKINRLKGTKGNLILAKVTINSFEHEEYLVITAVTDSGDVISSQECEELFTCDSSDSFYINIDDKIIAQNSDENRKIATTIINNSRDENQKKLSKAIDDLERSNDEQIQGLELEVNKLREKRTDLIKNLTLSQNDDEKQKLTNEIDIISKRIRKQWGDLIDAEEVIEKEKIERLDKLKDQFMKSINVDTIFRVNFEVE